MRCVLPNSDDRGSIERIVQKNAKWILQADTLLSIARDLYILPVQAMNLLEVMLIYRAKHCDAANEDIKLELLQSFFQHHTALTARKAEIPTTLFGMISRAILTAMTPAVLAREEGLQALECLQSQAFKITLCMLE
jgi:hypothetical protein